MSVENEQDKKEELVKEAMETRNEEVDEDVEKEMRQDQLAGQDELMKMLKEDEEELFRKSKDEQSGEIEELKDDADDLREEAIVPEDEIKKEYIRKITETHRTFRVCIPKEIIREKNLRPQDKVVFTTDDTDDNVVILKIYFDKDPTNFRMPFDKWEEMKYGDD